jgi:fructose-1-phosphate kinase PfkB-like protein
MIKVTVSDRFADPPICLYDPESRVCFIPGKLVELDERELTVEQRRWLEQGALVVVSGREASSLAETSYVDLYRKAKEAGLKYAARPRKERLIEDLSAAQKAAGALTRPEGISNG